MKQLQQEIDAYIRGTGAGYWPPLSNLARLIEEVGELAREINHEFGDKPKKATEREGSIAEELADVVFVAACIANSLQIDLEAAVRHKLEVYRTRDKGRWDR